MCDYSLENFKSEPAKVGDKLIVRHFGTGTTGFGYAKEWGWLTSLTAVCLRPGTEVAFDDAITWNPYAEIPRSGDAGNLAIFREIDSDKRFTHRDALEVPGGEVIKLNFLTPGQTATVLQLPAEAAIKDKAEVDALIDALIEAGC
jgi:hypothetical protein